MIIIEHNTDRKLYFQIYEYYRNEILSGGFEEGSRLPSTRSLAAEAGVSRNTVETAYQQLEAEGYATAVSRKGYVVKAVEHMPAAEKRISFCASDDTAEEDMINIPGIRYNFQYGRLSAEVFPAETFKRTVNRIMMDTDTIKITGYSSSTGEPELKEEIARYIYESRNVCCEADRIVVCSGIFTAISLISQMFHRKTKAVAIEEPCYDTVRHIFENNGYIIEPVPVTADGIDMGALQKCTAKVIYITPSHQFPTGRVMSAANRIKLLQWAQKTDAYIIEDDYDSEYRYDINPISPLQSLDDYGRVIYLNTFSKALAPALRLGYMVLPAQLKKIYDTKFSHYSCSVPLITQLAVADFMASGKWTRHLRKAVNINRKKHDVLANEINTLMGDSTEIIGNNAGLHFILRVDNGMGEDELMASARKLGVMVYPVSQYYKSPPEKSSCVLIGFGGMSVEDIPAGVRLLKEAWFENR